MVTDDTGAEAFLFSCQTRGNKKERYFAQFINVPLNLDLFMPHLPILSFTCHLGNWLKLIGVYSWSCEWDFLSQLQGTHRHLSQIRFCWKRRATSLLHVSDMIGANILKVQKAGIYESFESLELQENKKWKQTNLIIVLSVVLKTHLM